ncbi:hypothetical protein GCM10009630_05510 [Kribbella jejuensis]|uniref:DUF7674 domain-containing protein n=1 Tax=Kribbella jejuensis TaxID=236068 RepID=A0A542ER93_9ACTN|nr:hypothetical protein [Kribbella jejuensis]TQJ17878.1 hypothetical protein FB475_2008 [Kribbella jejuensis]
MTEPDEALVRRMFAAVPGLRSELDEYLRSYVGDWAGPPVAVEHLPGFLVKLALDCRRRGADRRDQIRELLVFLESELGHDDLVDELIESFFVAYLPEPADRSAQVLELLGPKLWEAREDQLLDDAAGVLESVVDFVFKLGEEVPQAADRVAEHAQRRRYGGFADAVLAELSHDAAELAASDRWLEVGPLLDFLESEYGENPAVDNAIDVSFLELLPAPGERGGEILRMLGPRLRAAYRRSDPPAGQPGGRR